MRDETKKSARKLETASQKESTRKNNHRNVVRLFVSFLSFKRTSMHIQLRSKEKQCCISSILESEVEKQNWTTNVHSFRDEIHDGNKHNFLHSSIFLLSSCYFSLSPLIIWITKDILAKTLKKLQRIDKSSEKWKDKRCAKVPITMKSNASQINKSKWIAKSDEPFNLKQHTFTTMAGTCCIY